MEFLPLNLVSNSVKRRAKAIPRSQVLKNAHVYLENLPKGEMYEKNLARDKKVNVACAYTVYIYISLYSHVSWLFLFRFSMKRSPKKYIQ